MIPLNDVNVNVYLAGTVTRPTIYAARTGGTAKTNPFLTGIDGVVEFWVDAGEYDISFVETQVPARFSNYTLGFNALPAASGGIPTSRLTADAGIGLAHLNAAVTRQFVPIGGVINWWRPDATEPVPTGFEICDGRVITSANHDFASMVGQSISLPDLRNRFILGANVTLSDAAAGSNGDTATNAPGIRGAAGSNAAEDLAHTHTISNSSIVVTAASGTHTHTISDTGVMGTLSSSTHTHTIAYKNFDFYYQAGFSSGTASLVGSNATSASGAHAHYISGHDHGGATGSGGDHTHAIADHAHGGATASALSSAADLRPRYYGLLQIMKVKRN